MKYVFIINPVSGQANHHKKLVPSIEKIIADREDDDITIKYTFGSNDATVLADQIAKESMPDSVTIFACGGDGTINEVASGIYGHTNATLGLIPVGSGNDFVRAVANRREAAQYFINLPKQFEGTESIIDLMRLDYELDGKKSSMLVVNGINIGIDGDTAIKMSDYKRIPGVSGHMAYYLAVLGRLVKKECQFLKVTCDGKEFYDGKLLLITVANGGYCGGGVQSCPRADLRNGFAEVQAIKEITRMKFLSLFKKYKDGKIEELKEYDDYVRYTRAKEIEISPLKSKTMKFVADGEIVEAEKIKVTMIPSAIKVLIPKI